MTELYLGKVCLANMKIARLIPIAVRANGKWVSIQDPIKAFPPEGKVLGVKSELIHASEDSVWSFRTRENPIADKDRFLVEDPIRATLVLDLSKRTLEQARSALFETGVELPRGSDGHVIVLLDGGLMAEQWLSFDRGLGKWRAAPSSTPVMLARAPDEVIDAANFQGHSFLPDRAALKWEVTRKVDWSSDTDFVEHTINRFRRISKNLIDTPHGLPAKSAVQYVARALRDSDLISRDEDIVQNLDRLKAQWARIENALGAADGLVELVMETSAAKAVIESAVKRETAAAKAAMRTEIEQQVRQQAEVDLAELTRRRDALLEDIATREKESRQLEAARLKAQESCRDASKALETLQRSIDAEVARLRQAFEALSATEISHARGLAERLARVVSAGTIGPSPSLLPPALPPWAVGEEAASVESISPTSGLIERLRIESEANGIEITDLRLIDGFARAGELVVLLGRANERALTAYARSVSGGRVRVMTLDATVIGVDDLWRIPGSQLPTALAFAWTAALAAPNKAILACLHGLETAPLRAWLPALANILRSAVRPKNLLVLATADVQASPSPATAVDIELWLSGAAVPLCPRDREHAGLNVLHAKTRDSAAAFTVLQVDQRSERTAEISAGLLALASDEARNPSTVVRAVAALDALGQTMADPTQEQLVASWALTVDTGKVGTLPPALGRGYEALATLQSVK